MNISNLNDTIHRLASKCRIATVHDTVHHSECVYTFHTPYTSSRGIVVNLQTFIGTVDAYAFQKDTQGSLPSSTLSLRGKGNEEEEEEEEMGLFVRIVKQRIAIVTDKTKNIISSSSSSSQTAAVPGACEKKKEEDDNSEEDNATVQFITKLGIGIEGGFPSEDQKFDTVCTYSIVLLRKLQDGAVVSSMEVPHVANNNNNNNNHNYTDTKTMTLPLIIRQSADSIIHHTGTALQQDLTVWELEQEPKPISKYAYTIPFVDNGIAISPQAKDWKCEKSGDTQNLWLNLSDGFIGGGRKNWDGSGGSNGALDHYLETGKQFPLVVKLGTITQDIDMADCYSYADDEDCPVLVPNLAELLHKRGIHVANMQKTVKTTSELEVELNANYNFDAITESGSSLLPISQPGVQGLQNLGNSCYMNSVVQMLFSGCVPELFSRYGYRVQRQEYKPIHDDLVQVSPTHAPLDIICQAAKLCRALTSEEFAPPATVPGNEEMSDPKYRIAPRMFKHVIGRDHVDFRTGQQQDAAQYLQFLLEKLDRAELGSQGRISKKGATVLLKSSSLFAFQTIARRVCTLDHRVKYTTNAQETLWSLRIPGESSTMMEPDEKRQRSEWNNSDVNKDSSAVSPNKVPTVTFQACIDAWSASHTISDVRWDHLGFNVIGPATETSSFANFPRYLIIRLQRYELGSDWTPRKLEVNVDVPEFINLNHLRSRGPQDGESIIPNTDENCNSPDDAVTASRGTAMDESAVSQLQEMGFSENGCRRALKVVGGSDIEAAMNWIFEHSMDPDFNEPLPDERALPRDSFDLFVDDYAVNSLVQTLGCFTADQVRIALAECAGMPDRAADWLFSHMDDLDSAIALGTEKKAPVSGKISTHHAAENSPSSVIEDGDGKYAMIGMISHIGKNTSSGHYVAHLKKDGRWVIFNDEKTSLSETPPFPHAYLYLFQRADSIEYPNRSY